MHSRRLRVQHDPHQRRPDRLGAGVSPMWVLIFGCLLWVWSMTPWGGAKGVTDFRRGVDTGVRWAAGVFVLMAILALSGGAR